MVQPSSHWPGNRITSLRNIRPVPYIFPTYKGPPTWYELKLNKWHSTFHANFPAHNCFSFQKLKSRLGGFTPLLMWTAVRTTLGIPKLPLNYLRNCQERGKKLPLQFCSTFTTQISLKKLRDFPLSNNKICTSIACAGSLLDTYIYA